MKAPYIESLYKPSGIALASAEIKVRKLSLSLGKGSRSEARRFLRAEESS